MNERIRELVELSGLPIAWISDNGVIRWSNLERFAELIVKDCLTVADRRGAYQVMDDIIERFGVDL
jgi:hypothetical protein